MASAPVVVTDAGDDTPALGQLFQGVSFFLSARLPTRSRFLADVKANGGRVVPMEKNADYVIVDDLRKPTPAGSFSYKLIEHALRDGVFPNNPAEYALGPTADGPRAAGSNVPGKRTRTPFTLEDDTALWEWVELAKAHGGSVKGNDIYKRLEATNPRHTWQAWRDRYVKRLIDEPRPIAQIAVEVSPGQGSEEEDAYATTPGKAQSKKRRLKQLIRENADGDDFDILWAQAKDIVNMDVAVYEAAWGAWAQVHPKFKAAEWRYFWESEVRPAYHEHRAKVKAKRRRTLASDAEKESSAGTRSRKKSKRHNEDETEIVTSRPASPAAGPNEDTTGANNAQIDADDDLEAPNEDLDALETWRESSPSHRLHKSDMPTSEVDRAVDQQLRAEVNGDSIDTSEQILASNTNRAADLQVQNETDGPLSGPQERLIGERSDVVNANQADAIQTPLQHSARTSGAFERQGSDGTNDELGANSGRTESDPPALNAPPQLLTESNLASQRAQHEEPLTRGVDLPKDDLNKDQSEYVKFLQTVTGQPSNDNAIVGVAQSAQAASNIPVSSNQEVDDAMKDALSWPSSPQRERDQPESQMKEFETQLPRAAPSLLRNHAQGDMLEADYSSQSFLSQTSGKTHPSQGEHAASVRVSPATHQHVVGTQAGFWNSDNFVAQPNNFQGLGDIDGMQIDLRIPQPEGDLTITSSPAREGASPDQTTTILRKLGGIVEPEAGGSKALDKLVERTDLSRPEVVDISSNFSSSSTSSHSVREAIHEPVETVQYRKSHALETQDIISAETQAPDFFIPLPDDEQDNENEHGSKLSRRYNHSSQKSAAAETRALDLSVPSPWSPEIEAEIRAPGTESVLQSMQKQNVVESQTMNVERELESWLDTQHVRGYNEASAIAAMQRSSMRPELAELILFAEKGGLGLPSDVPGIWSEREDQVLESGDSGALRRLEAKHGWDECHARMRFLDEWREA